MILDAIRYAVEKMHSKCIEHVRLLPESNFCSTGNARLRPQADMQPISTETLCSLSEQVCVCVLCHASHAHLRDTSQLQAHLGGNQCQPLIKVEISGIQLALNKLKQPAESSPVNPGPDSKLMTMRRFLQPVSGHWKIHMPLALRSIAN